MWVLLNNSIFMLFFDCAFGISTINANTMIKSHNQILKTFLYVIGPVKINHVSAKNPEL